MLLVSFPRHLTPGPSSLSLIILFIFQRTREFVLEHFTFFELRRLRFLHLVSCLLSHFLWIVVIGVSSLSCQLGGPGFWVPLPQFCWGGPGRSYVVCPLRFPQHPVPGLFGCREVQFAQERRHRPPLTVLRDIELVPSQSQRWPVRSLSIVVNSQFY